MTHVFLGFLTNVLTQLSFQSHRLPFSHASAEVRGEGYQNSQPPGHESDTLIIALPGRGSFGKGLRDYLYQTMAPILQIY